MKRILSLILAVVMTVALLCGCGDVQQPDAGTGNPPQSENKDTNAGGEDTMSKSRQEYEALLNDLSAFPVNFVYNDIYFGGFDESVFKETSRTVEKIRNGEKTTVELTYDVLSVTVEAEYYEDYDAYDYTVYFENIGRENSGVIRNLNAVDMRFAGKEPRLKGILGDYDNHYAEYDKDLTEETVSFVNKRGRPTHTTFPYFNLETENGGAMLAIGWGGTWEADFVYNAEEEATRFTGTGTVGLCTYLEPGEVIRTPMVGVVRYYERDEDVATNAWRRWLVDCIYPRDSADSEECAQPFSTVYHCFDTDNPARFTTDGSTAEDYRYWKPSVDAAYNHGLIYDVQWFDAGWYEDPYGNTVESDWWGTVGTWTLDSVKWPEGTFEERVNYAHEHGQKFMVWFEPDRVTHLDGMVDYGYKREWVLSDHGNNNAYLSNLGNKDCLAWTLDKILTFMEKYDIDIYREDFNIDPGIFWTVGDGYEGQNRKGITENLYVQGHYALYDGILKWAAEHGKPTYIDGCASGGGRNDLETLRRAIHINRSDSDRFTTTYRLSLTPRVCKWLPFNGTVAKDAVSLTDNFCDLYALRASYMCVYEPAANFYLDSDTIDWEMYRQGLAEFNEIKKYLLKDFYALTPDHSTTDDTNWTAFMYFDPASDSGVLQAFRQTKCDEKTVTVQVKGVNPDGYYTIRDVDGLRSIARVKGSTLLSGLRISADNARTAVTLYIEPTV